LIMEKRIIAIHQPNFFPWFGYFLKIARCQVFVFLDDVQIQKTGSSYTNRVNLNIQGESKWVTAPIKRHDGVWNINQTYFADINWRKKIITTLKINYSKAAFIKQHADFIFNLINCEDNNLANYNINAILQLLDLLDIKSEIYYSSKLGIAGESTDRLINIINKLNGTTYLSGGGGDKYQEKKVFDQNNIQVIYNQFEQPIYTQINSNAFIPGLSILDMIFNLGKDETIEHLKESK
jgi:hypothetical protein